MIVARWIDADLQKEAPMVTTIPTGVALGERSPDWLLPTLNGGALGPSSFRGTKTLFFFWGSW
jgi:hypothetical protein